MNMKSGRILHYTILTIILFAATSVIFYNQNILTSSNDIRTVKYSTSGKVGEEYPSNTNFHEGLIVAEQGPPVSALLLEPAKTLQNTQSDAVQAMNSTIVVTNKPVKASSSSTVSQPKTRKVTATPKPTPKPAVYTISGNGRTCSITADELNLFARLVSAEATGESYEGKLAVATVVINRVLSGTFPSSLTQVIMGKESGYYQFTPVLDGRINNPPTADAVKAVDQILGGYRSFSTKVMWFLNPQKSTSSWIADNKTYYKTIGNHDFYF